MKLILGHKIVDISSKACLIKKLKDIQIGIEVLGENKFSDSVPESFQEKK